MIATWLSVPYRDHGRTLAGADCWGLVRLARQALRGDILPAYGAIAPADKPAITQGAQEVMASGWRPVAPAPGVLATVWRSGLLLHIGIVCAVDGMLGVLDTTRRTGPRWQRLTDFERHHRVVYYDDCD